MALSDIDLVMLAKAAHDETAFAELVRRHQAGLRVFLRRLSGSAALADDLAQEALLKAYRRIGAFAGGSSFRSWLYAIAWREFLQSKRKDGARERLAGSLEHSATATSVAGGADLSLDLRRALTTLDENERAAILLCDAAGLSHGEAAAALGTPLGTIKSQVARARDKMRAALEAKFPEAGAAGEASRKGAFHVV